MTTLKGKNTKCPRCSTAFNIDKNRAFTIDGNAYWFYEAMAQFENFSTVKCPECRNVFKAPEARLFGVFKSPYTVFVLSSLLGLMIVLISYFLFFKKN